MPVPAIPIPLVFDRVMEESDTVGTGDLALLGALPGYRAMSSVLNNDDMIPYGIWSVDAYGTPDGGWETGIGTYSSTGPVLVRTVVYESSNANALVSFPAGPKRVALLPPAKIFALPSGSPGGRLSTESGYSASISDRTAQGTLYWVPHANDYLRMYDGYRIKEYVCPQKQLALTMTSGKNYDVFLYESGGAPALELSAAWTNDTTRADALFWMGGLGWVKSATPTRLHVGTIRASASNVTADSGGEAGTTQVGAQRFVWNRYNQLIRTMKVIDTTDSWAYTGGIRQANGASGNKIEYVVGNSSTAIMADLVATSYQTSSVAGYSRAGLGLDSTSAFSGLVGMTGLTTAAYLIAPLIGKYYGFPGLGYHYLAWLETGDGGPSGFYGDNGGGCQSGISAWLMG